MDLDKGLGYRFSWATQKNPNSNDSMMLFNAGKYGNQIDDANKIIQGFPVVMEWYKLIGGANDLDPLHPLVAEAYWVGNDLLERAYDFQGIHETITERFADKFKERVPVSPEPGNFPHHNLHVAIYGIVSDPSASGEDRLSCRVIPGRVNLQWKVDNFLGIQAHDSVDLNNPFHFVLGNGDLVLLHRGIVCAKANDNTVRRVLKYGYNRI